MNELNGEGVEGELTKTVFYSLLTSCILLAILYFFNFKNMPGFISQYGIVLFFSALSYALVIPSLRQVRAYREMTCMSGMMIGMTTGMIAGFLAGFYVASTNGMFYGGFFGVAVGIGLGIWNGKCCGIMGIMEGTMAGFMGGLMGAMTAFMLINDHLNATSVLVFIISAALLIMLNFMIYKETKHAEREHKEDNSMTIVLTFILTAVTTWLVVYGPRGGFFGG